ncbi:MAG: hypothetical protein AAGK01_05195, partial [Pseudomonadota bacterium]
VHPSGLKDGRGVVFKQDGYRYCAGWPDQNLLRILIETMARETGVKTQALPEGVRLRETANHVFAFNYSSKPVDTQPLDFGEPLMGTAKIMPAGCAVWTKQA